MYPDQLPGPDLLPVIPACAYPLPARLDAPGEVELDFNRAFNPYCAYTDAYECGFPPAGNQA